MRLGEIDDEAVKLMQVTEESLYAGIRPGRRRQPYHGYQPGCAKCVEDNGLYVVRGYTGHGVGRQMHEPPQVLNYVSGDADGQLCDRTGARHCHRAHGAAANC